MICPRCGKTINVAGWSTLVTLLYIKVTVGCTNWKCGWIGERIIECMKDISNNEMIPVSEEQDDRKPEC